MRTIPLFTFMLFLYAVVLWCVEGGGLREWDAKWIREGESRGLGMGLGFYGCFFPSCMFEGHGFHF